MKKLIVKNEIVEWDFNETYENFQGMVYDYSYSWLRKNPAIKVELEDLIQISNIALWEAYEEYDISNETHFTTYLHYKIMAHLQSETRQHYALRRSGESCLNIEHFEDLDDSGQGIYNDDLGYIELMDFFESLEDDLSELDFKILMLMATDKYSVEEIGNKLGRSRAWTYLRRNAIREIVKEKLGVDYFDLY